MASNPFVVTHAERVEIDRAESLLDHRHDTNHVLIVLAGEVVEDGQTYRQGTVRWSAASDRHFLRFLPPVRCAVIEIDGSVEFVGQRRVSLDAEAAMRLTDARCDDHVRDLLTRHRWRALEPDRHPPSWLSEFQSRCEDGRFMKVRGVATAARQAGVSREHLARQFRSHFGTTVTAAMRVRRLREAYDLLRGSVRPVADIADACGFSDQSHLTRELSSWIGLTPGRLRRITPVQDLPAA